VEQTLTEPYVIGRPTTGEQVGNYLLLHEIGRGGYAQVYLVERIVLKAMEKAPRQRFAHVLEFASALKNAS
jgi:hypothetical protein